MKLEYYTKFGPGTKLYVRPVHKQPASDIALFHHCIAGDTVTKDDFENVYPAIFDSHFIEYEFVNKLSNGNPK